MVTKAAMVVRVGMAVRGEATAARADTAAAKEEGT
jgi:hypothetical protein